MISMFLNEISLQKGPPGITQSIDCPDDIGPSTRCQRIASRGCYCFVSVGVSYNQRQSTCP